MHTHKILKFINLSIAVLLAAVLIGAYWYAWRPLPVTSGTIAAPITRQATVSRDSLGVPHIFAASFEDAIFLQGFVTAQDRMWQMDVLRRLAAGELSEILGKAGIEFDGESRRLRLRRLAEEHLRTMPAADRAVLAAYARGVNHFIETHSGRWGLEFALLGYDPKPWSAVDSLLAGLQMYRTLTNSWKLEVQKQNMRQGGDAAKVDVLYPLQSGLEFTPGSNAWVLSGKLTASGKPILANDPHLDFAIPATWYQVHIGAPGLNVTGVSLPGVPCVIIGHNDRIAWGITNLHFDVQDLYREQFNPANGQYLFRGAVERARAEPQVILVKGEKPISFTTWVTQHGPVFLNEGGQYYSLRWTAAEPGGFQFPFADLNRARNWEQFNAAIMRMPGPGSNFVYADVDGNIGYHAAGMLPIRRSFNGDVPVDGSSGENEWAGFIPFEELPSAYNPPSGRIVTSNQNPFPDSYAHRVTGDFAPNFRAQQILAALSRRGQWKPEEMLVIQKDVYASSSHSLAKQLVAAHEKRKSNDAALAAAVDVLRPWNGQMDKDAAAPMIVALAFQQLRSAIASVASPTKGDVYTPQVSPSVIDGLLRERPKGWFADWDQALVKALADGVEAGAKLQGGNPSHWKYGKYNELTIRHPVANELPLVGKYFNIGPIYMSGSPTTIKQTTQKLGPSMRFVADLANWENSLNSITIGQSGHFFSSHYKDQWRSYWVGASYPMQFGKVKADATLTVNPLK